MQDDCKCGTQFCLRHASDADLYVKDDSRLKILELPPFRSGDVVVLKSGSPHLTVGAVEKDSIVVTWFASDGAASVLKMPSACFLPVEEGNA